MDFTPRTVLIPVAGMAESGRMARVQADGGTPEANAAGLDPQIADLNNWELYEAGAIALGAVRRLHLPVGRVAGFRRFRPQVIAGTLSVTNGPDIRGLMRAHNRSAELGLALALLMYAAQSKVRAVIATGQLARDASPQGSFQNDVAVLPVERLPAKIETIARSLDSHKGGAMPQDVLFFLPRTTSEGKETSAVFQDALEGLRTSFAKHGLRLDICPVSSLREALDRLGIDSLQMHYRDRLVLAGAGGLAGLAGLALAGYLWLTAPLELSFAKIDMADGTAIASPARAVHDARSGKFVFEKHCKGPRRLPVYRAGDWMILRARVADGGGLASLLGGYHFTIVTVSEKSGIKVFPPKTFRKAAMAPEIPEEMSGQRGGEISVALPVEGPAEKNKVIVLARRAFPFNSRKLRQGLEQALARVQPAQYVNAAVSHLAGEAPGYLDYSFLSVKGEPECAKD